MPKKPELKSTYYVPDIRSVTNNKHVEYRWDDDVYDNELLRRGVVCATREAANILFDHLVAEAQSQSYGMVFE